MASSKKMHLPIEMSVNSNGLRRGLQQAQTEMGRFADKSSQKVQQSFGLGNAFAVAGLMKAGKILSSANTVAYYARHYNATKRELQARARAQKSAAPTLMGWNETRTRFIGPPRAPHLADARNRRFAQKQSLMRHRQTRREARFALGMPGGNLKSVLMGALMSPLGMTAIIAASTSVVALAGLKSARDAQASAKRGDAYNPAIIRAVVEKDLKQFRIDRAKSKNMTTSSKMLMDAQMLNSNMGGSNAGNMGNLIDAGGNTLGAAVKGMAGYMLGGQMLGWALGWNNGPFGINKFVNGAS